MKLTKSRRALLQRLSDGRWRCAPNIPYREWYCCCWFIKTGRFIEERSYDACCRYLHVRIRPECLDEVKQMLEEK